MQFLPSCSRIDTAIWMYYLDANKTAGEKAGRQLHKNAAATPHKTPTIRPPTPITKTIQVRRTRMGQIELLNYSL